MYNMASSCQKASLSNSSNVFTNLHNGRGKDTAYTQYVTSYFVPKFINHLKLKAYLTPCGQPTVLVITRHPVNQVTHKEHDRNHPDSGGLPVDSTPLAAPG